MHSGFPILVSTALLCRLRHHIDHYVWSLPDVIHLELSFRHHSVREFCSRYSMVSWNADILQMHFGHPTFLLFELPGSCVEDPERSFPFTNRSLRTWWYKASSSGRSLDLMMEVRDMFQVVITLGVTLIVKICWRFSLIMPPMKS